MYTFVSTKSFNITKNIINPSIQNLTFHFLETAITGIVIDN